MHLHLDCSVSYPVAQRLSPGLTEAEFRANFIAPPKCTDLSDYLTRAHKGIEVMQTKAALEWVTLDLLDQLKADQILYAEIRFAPFEHLHRGLKVDEVVQTVLDALELGCRRTGLRAGLILCTLRHYPAARSLEVARLAVQFKGTRVVGFDIAGDEAGFPLKAHIAAFELAHQHGIPCTAHAGEALGPKSVQETLQELGPGRVGHGVRSIEDPDLIQLLLDHRIHLEVCPTSNIQTNVFERMPDHAVDRLYRAGVSVGINTDARTISDVCLSDEYATLHAVFQWDRAHFLKCNLNAVAAAFTSDSAKDELRTALIEAYAVESPGGGARR